MVFHGRGYASAAEARDSKAKPDKKATLKLMGPEIGYIFCSIAMVAVAATILDDKLRDSGGVLTPASAMKGTKYVDRLIKRGVKFEFEEGK